MAYRYGVTRMPLGPHDLSTLLLDVDDLASVLDEVGLETFLDELIERLTVDISAFDPTHVQQKVCTGFNYDVPELGMIEWMSTMLTGDIVAVKTVGYHPRNPVERSIPSVLATTALYDTNSGGLVALTEATLLTALRTGAASAVVTNAVAKDGPITLGVVGCGAQAVTQIHAISRTREISRLIVTDIDGENAKSLVARLPEDLPKPEVHTRAGFDLAVPELDVLVTATSVEPGGHPVVGLELAAPHLHINAVGADVPGKTELSQAYVRNDDVVVIPDVIEQCLAGGEAQRLGRGELGPDIVEVLARDWDALRNQQTVFDSTGWAYEDLIAATLFVAHAIRLELGVTVDLQRAPVDPLDPYEILRPITGE